MTRSSSAANQAFDKSQAFFLATVLRLTEPRSFARGASKSCGWSVPGVPENRCSIPNDRHEDKSGNCFTAKIRRAQSSEFEGERFSTQG